MVLFTDKIHLIFHNGETTFTHFKITAQKVIILICAFTYEIIGIMFESQTYSASKDLGKYNFILLRDYQFVFLNRTSRLEFNKKTSLVF